MKPTLQTYSFETASVNEYGEVIARQTGHSRFFVIDLGIDVKLRLIEIQAGQFLMGSPLHETGHRGNESPQHAVNVKRFFLGRCPVTQAQWRALMGSLPSMGEAFRGDDLPVVNVWWEQAQEFCARLTQHCGHIIRLPSEAEWEFACRAGTTTPFHTGKTITTALANYNGNFQYGQASAGEYRQCTTPAGYFQTTNAFGLCDMHGNVWEWCADAWHVDYQGAPNDGSAWLQGDEGYRVQRGGSWADRAEVCRSAFRVGDIAHNSDHIVGLRIASEA